MAKRKYNILTEDDILQIQKLHPEKPLIIADFAAKKKNNKFATLPTYYIPLLFLNKEGKYESVKFISKCKLVTVAYPKIFDGNKSDEKKSDTIPKVSFTFQDIGDFPWEKTDYKAGVVEPLKRDNKKFIEVMNIIHNAYNRVVDELSKRPLSDYENKFTKANPKTPATGPYGNFGGFRQDFRKFGPEEPADIVAKYPDGLVPLEKPMYRFSMKANADGVFKSSYQFDKSKPPVVSPMIYDARSKEKIELKHDKQSITMATIRSAIPMYSLVELNLKFGNLSLSKSGVGHGIEISSMRVAPHRKITNGTAELEDLSNYMDVNVDEPVESDPTLETPQETEMPSEIPDQPAQPQPVPAQPTPESAPTPAACPSSARRQLRPR